ncbi:MAG: hypothetical protein QXD20_07760 [Ignisphaera sp.]
MKSTHIKTISTALLTLLVLSILPATVLLIKPTYAQGSITPSSANLNPEKVIALDIRGDLGNQPSLRVLRPDGTPVELEWRNGTTDTVFYAYRIATGRYVAYLGGEDVDLIANPASPLPGTPDISIARLATSIAKGTTLTIEVVGTDIKASVIYDTVDSTLTIDLSPKVFAYRRLDVRIPLTIVDPDLDKDPTAKDSVDSSQISVTLRLIKAEGGEASVPTTLNRLLPSNLSTTLTETAVGSATFKTLVSLSAINNELSGQLNRWIYEGDRLLISVQPTSAVQGGWSDAAPGSDAATAVYRKPTVEIIATNQRVTVRIVSPDDNIDPNNRDTLDCQDINIVEGDGNPDTEPDTEIVVSVAGVSMTFACSDFRETGVNTGVFEKRFNVAWGNNAGINATTITYPRGSKEIIIEAHYRMRTGQLRPLGYNVDASGSGAYVPVVSEISVTKATIKTISLTVVDQDLNTRSNSVEYLTASYATAGQFDLNLLHPETNVVLARITLKDIYGSIVSVTPNTSATALISFVETDFDKGEFTVRIDSRRLGISPGAEYILEYRDYTAGPGTVITLPIKIAPLAIELDRAVYPVNRNGIVVYVTYTNDRYNEDPSRRDPVNVTVSVRYINGTEDTIGTYTLSETDIDSGVFAGSINIPGTWFATPGIIDATLIVSGPDDISTTARVRAHDADVTVDKTVVRWGDVVEIKVRDMDGNRDSKARDSVTINILGTDKTCRETDVNTGEFICRFTVSWDDPLFRVEPGTTITVRYVDETPIMSPTAATWRTVPYVATFKVATFTGELIVETVEDGFVGVLEEFDVVVKDPDLNRYMGRADNPVADSYVRDVISVSFEGIPVAPSYSVSETGINTSTFSLELAEGTKLSLVMALEDAGILSPGLTPRQRAETMAQYIGKRVTIAYIDDRDATGSRKITTKTLTIKAWDAAISVDKEAVNLGEWLTINITNKDIAGTTVTEYRTVILRSDSYPTGIMFIAEEVAPGVFQVKVQVVDVNAWIPGAKQIPAKIGDRITIEYVDPVTADGRAYATFTKTVGVGVFVPMPGRAEKVVSVDVVTGQTVTPKVGREVFLTVTLRNTDIVERGMTAIVVVRDPAGVAVARFAAAATLGAGASTEVSFGWTPIVSGSHTVEVYIVKSLADRTPVGEPAEFSIGVEA